MLDGDGDTASDYATGQRVFEHEQLPISATFSAEIKWTCCYEVTNVLVNNSNFFIAELMSFWCIFRHSVTYYLSILSIGQIILVHIARHWECHYGKHYSHEKYRITKTWLDSVCVISLFLQNFTIGWWKCHISSHMFHNID